MTLGYTVKDWTKSPTKSAYFRHYVPYTTSDNGYVVLDTVDCWQYTQKGFGFLATTNALTVKLEVAPLPGSPVSVTLGTVDLTPGINRSIVLESMFANMTFSVKPKVAGQHGTLAGSVYLSQDPISTRMSPIGYESIAVTNAAAVGFTVATADSAVEAFVTVEDNPIRVRWDGTAPTTSEGHILQSGDTLILTGGFDLYNFKAIATTSSAAVLKVTYSS